MTIALEHPVNPYSAYVPRLLVEWAIDDPDAEYREIPGTAVFADISGFTALSEMLSKYGKLGAEEVTEVIGNCFRSLMGIVHPLGGHLLKFGGDALLLFFNGPGHERRAANAAVGMMEEMGRVGKVRTSGGRLTLRMSIGAHTDTFDFYLVGDSHRELIISGSGASVTADMESAADAGEIAVSSATAEALPKEALGKKKGDAFLLKQSVAPPDVKEIDLRSAELDLEQYVPTAMREPILADAIEAEHRQVTVAFIQFLGVEKLRHEEGMPAVAAALHELVADVQHALDTRSLTFVSTDIYPDGGKIIVAAGAPTSTGADEERMMLALDEIRDKTQVLDVRIGVNRGHVFSGDVGPEYRHSYTVMGDDVNLAARLMSAAEIGEIRATPAVLDQTRTAYEVTELKPFMVKGKAEPVVAYSVGQEIGTKVARDEHELPFMGRDDELAQLTEAIEGLANGSGSAISLVGGRGIGKTRLMDEAITGLEQVIEIRAEPYGATNPYRPLRDPLRALLGIDRGEHSEMAHKLRKAVAELDESLLPLLPLVADVLHIEVPSTPEADEIELKFRPERAAEMLTTIIAECLPGPVVISVDDAHWVDDASTLILNRLCAATTDLPWLVIATRREMESGFQPPGASIALGPLDQATAHQLVIAITEDAPLRPHDLEVVVERANGNPLYLGEIVAAVKSAGSVDELPDSLDALVTAQIDSLPSTARRLLRYAAVLGRSFRPQVLARVLNGDGNNYDKLIENELAAFLERDDGRIRFRHAIHRDAAYEGLSYRRRRELHLAAGNAMKELAPDPDEAAEALSMHFFLGGDYPAAWRFSLVAGTEAKSEYNNVEAAAAFERAIQAASKTRKANRSDVAAVWLSLGQVREQLAQFPAAIDAFKRAASMMEDEADQAEAISKRASAKSRMGSYSSALGDATRGLRLLEGRDDAKARMVKARLMTGRASIRMAQENAGEALVAANAAIEVARDAREDESLLRAYDIHDWACLVLGHPEDAVFAEKALTIAERIGHLDAAGIVMNNLGGKAYFAGDWDLALEMYEKSRDARIRTGNSMEAAWTAANIGELLISRGRFDEAEPVLKEAIRTLRASEAIDGALFAETQLGRLELERGEFDRAIELLEAARNESIEQGQTVNGLEAALYVASRLCAHGPPGRCSATDGGGRTNGRSRRDGHGGDAGQGPGCRSG